MVPAGPLPTRRPPLPAHLADGLRALVAEARCRLRRADAVAAGLQLSARSSPRAERSSRAVTRLRDTEDLHLRSAASAVDRHRAWTPQGPCAAAVTARRARHARRNVPGRRSLVALLARIDRVSHTHERRHGPAADAGGGDGADRIRRRRAQPVRRLRWDAADLR